MHLTRTLAPALRSWSVVLLVGVFFPACQLVLGDFTIDDSEIRPGTLGSACEPGTFRCREAQLERCADDRFGFEPYETCANAGACDPSAGSCRPCAAGELACNDGVLQQCAGDTWTILDTCATPALCTLTMARTIGACTPPECELGTFRCQDGRLEACAPTRDRWELVENCGSNARCSVDAAVAAVAAKQRPHCAAAACEDACPPGVCVPGATRCSSLVSAVEVCGTDGQWILRNACATDELCDGRAGRCQRPACDIGETRCLGLTRRTCSPDRTRFVDLEECPASGSCTSSGCEPTKCAEGEERCNGVSFERCVEGAFVPMDRCATPALCAITGASPGGCKPPVCGEGLDLFQCSGSGGKILSDCRIGRDSWREIGMCTDAQACTVDHGCVQMP